MNAIDKLIQTARNEIGYLEKASNSQLDDKTANAGMNNYTKYGKEMGCNGSAWCDAFVDWCFKSTFGTDLAKRMINGWSNYTPTSANYYKAINQFFSTPKIGDQIFFKNNTRICHTGIVCDVKDSVVYTIEGNTSGGSEVIANGGAVCGKKYSIYNSRIAGYGRPLYELAEEGDAKNMRYGIDVSDNQGVINWQKVKADGVDFAIIRTVKRSGAMDKYLLQNIKGCQSNNISIGFYKYSYAMTNKEAQEEAKSVVDALKSCGVNPSRDIIIWFDCEEDAQINLGKSALYDLYDCFKEVVWNSGFSYGLYMGKYDYEKNADFSDLDDYVWIARYPDTSARKVNNVPSASYKPVVRGKNKLYAWQFSSKGVVAGVDGNVDLNVCYVEDEKTTSPITTPETVSYYRVPAFTITECLNRIGVDSSKANRTKIAKKNGITNYTGTAEQNNKMVDLLLSGKLIK